jgi:hypothetical protein
MRGDKNWTHVNEIEHWAWESFSHALDGWVSALPPDSEVHYLDMLERMDAFFAAHPDGWPVHPDTPADLFN